MKTVQITLTLRCCDDVPVHVLDWMGGNLCEHAEHEFGCDYDPEFVDPAYDGPPLEAEADYQVSVVIKGESGDERARLRAEETECIWRSMGAPPSLRVRLPEDDTLTDG